MYPELDGCVYYGGPPLPLRLSARHHWFSWHQRPRPRFAAYKQTLAAIPQRTGAPLPSLVLSFGILHELTAIVPLVGCFYGARMLCVGERVVSAVLEDSDLAAGGGESSYGYGYDRRWAKRQMKTWAEDGERWAVRVGKRYGVFGYEKRAVGEVDGVEEMVSGLGRGQGHLAGDVANAVFAYGATKALLPVRVAVSLWLSPGFSRGVVESIRKSVVGAFRRKSS